MTDPSDHAPRGSADDGLDVRAADARAADIRAADDRAANRAEHAKAVRRARLRPIELLAFAAILGVFAGVVVLIVLREPLYALIAFGLAFIVSLVVLAMLALGGGAADERGDDDASPSGGGAHGL